MESMCQGLADVCAHLQLCSHADLMSSSAETDPASTASNSATKYTTASTKAMRLAVSMVRLGVCVCMCPFHRSFVLLIQQGEMFPRDQIGSAL